MENRFKTVRNQKRGSVGAWRANEVSEAKPSNHVTFVPFIHYVIRGDNLNIILTYITLILIYDMSIEALGYKVN